MVRRFLVLVGMRRINGVTMMRGMGRRGRAWLGRKIDEESLKRRFFFIEGKSLGGKREKCRINGLLRKRIRGLCLVR